MRALTLALAVCLPSAAAADDGLRCGQRLVSVGEREPAVLAKCGPPAAAEEYVHCHVVIHVWTYDRGPSELVRTLEFVDGVLRRVEAGDFGHCYLAVES